MDGSYAYLTKNKGYFMKKIILLLVGLLFIAGNAMAGCGTCEGKAHNHANKKKNKAACELKTEQDKAACEAKKKQCKTACEAKKKQCKTACETEKNQCKTPCKAEKKKCGSDCKKPCCAVCKDNASE